MNSSSSSSPQSSAEDSYSDQSATPPDFTQFFEFDDENLFSGPRQWRSLSEIGCSVLSMRLRIETFEAHGFSFLDVVKRLWKKLPGLQEYSPEELVEFFKETYHLRIDASFHGPLALHLAWDKDPINCALVFAPCEHGPTVLAISKLLDKLDVSDVYQVSYNGSPYLIENFVIDKADIIKEARREASLFRGHLWPETYSLLLEEDYYNGPISEWELERSSLSNELWDIGWWADLTH